MYNINLNDLEDIDVVISMFKADGVKHVDAIFEAITAESDMRRENIIELAELDTAASLTRATVNIGAAESKAQVLRSSNTDIGRHGLRKFAEICLKVYEAKGDLTREPVRTLAEALKRLSKKELNGSGIAKAYNKVIDKVAEDNNLEPAADPKKDRFSFFRVPKGPKPS